ncbi:MAG TPA: lipase [Phycisphaerales bacterium]|mgnify:CR=1 FL=1|nr:lipase [Phycisphaerales bacterium]|tara:strand:- start:423 stop:1418 length:996 start_codon:yes stop_codon:yes gene_type:complete
MGNTQAWCNAAASGSDQDNKQEPQIKNLGKVPNLADVKYGPHDRNVLDVYLAPNRDKPTPCVMHIHGGGWLGGDKTKFSIPGGPKAFLTEGITVVSINYRYLKQTIVNTGSTRGNGAIQPRGNYPEPPVKTPLYDAARALQFVRSHAKQWNIDPKRIAVTGGSAGACTSLWLAFHDDLADPQSPDPVARESTKPWCAATIGAQTSLDPVEILEWMPNATYGGHAFGYVWDHSDHTVEIRSFLKDRESVKHWIAEYSPYALVTKDDPPVYLFYGDMPEKGKVQKDPTHSSNYGALLVEKLERLGLDYEFVHKGIKQPRFKNTTEYLIQTLKK